MYIYIQKEKKSKNRRNKTIVEIDETVIIKRKYNVGILLKEIFVVSGICRNTCDILLEVISDHVEDGTIIFTNLWKGYNRLHEKGYSHFIVTHSTNFINPENGANTQIIDRMWRELKIPLKQRGYWKIECIDQYLCEFVCHYLQK